MRAVKEWLQEELLKVFLPLFSFPILLSSCPSS